MSDSQDSKQPSGNSEAQQETHPIISVPEKLKEIWQKLLKMERRLLSNSSVAMIVGVFIPGLVASTLLMYTENRKLETRLELTEVALTEAKQQLAFVKKETPIKVAELERQLEATKAEADEAKQKLASVMKEVQSKVAELEQQLGKTSAVVATETEQQSTLKEIQNKVAKLEQQLAMADLENAAKSTQEIKQQLRLLAEKYPEKVGIAASLSAWLRDLWSSSTEDRVLTSPPK